MALNEVERVDDLVPVRHVLVSVSDKAGLDELVPGLLRINPDIRLYSTGGTFRMLTELLREEEALRCLVPVSEYTGQPEMQGGLVKTLDFKIYLGLLSETYNNAHRDDLERMRAQAIDMVVVNLYPFESTVAARGVTSEQARTNIDIGGPCMLRAAAKNFLRVAPVTDPADYPDLLKTLESGGGALSLKQRFAFARKAFAHTAAYDRAITEYFATLDPARIGDPYRVERGALLS